jgi:hypothetical protein
MAHTLLHLGVGGVGYEIANVSTEPMLQWDFVEVNQKWLKEITIKALDSCTQISLSSSKKRES